MGGSLKRSLGMDTLSSAIPKGCAFEVATRLKIKTGKDLGQ